jgi:single-stranded-DNA-specific exonuclease
MKQWQALDATGKDFPSQDKVLYYSRMFNVDPLIIRLLAHNGIASQRDISEFFYSKIENLNSPFFFENMKKSIGRIIKAIKNKEKIMVYGDYDMDGMTSTAIMYKALKFFGADVFFRLPLRSEGYGITPESVDKIKHLDECSLIVTVDNGASAHEAMKRAHELGIDVIVTDHHEVLQGTPRCFAFINPKDPNCHYPFKDLCGAGVALKVVEALFMASRRDWDKYVWEYVELAALGTIADVMPLSGENRILVSFGLSKMNNQPSPVFKLLSKLLKLREITSTDIAFSIAPIFNSIGRIHDPNVAVKILTNQNVVMDDLLPLIKLNEDRKLLTHEHLQAIKTDIKDNNWDETNKIIVAHGDYHEGLIGILASNMADIYNKPSIVINNEGKGSCRSVQHSDFSIISAIQRCSHLLKSYGGHQAAAGLSIHPEQISAFRKEMQISAKQEPDVKPMIQYHCELAIGSFPMQLFDDLDMMEPFGEGNRKPLFFSPKTFAFFEKAGKFDDHLKFNIDDTSAFCFKKAHRLNEHTESNVFEFLYSPNSSRHKNFLIEDFNILD